MVKYEMMLVCKPYCSDEVAKMNDELSKKIAEYGGVYEKTVTWGLKRLAYEIKEFFQAEYLLVTFYADYDCIEKIKKFLSKEDVVFAYMPIEIED